MKRRFGSGLKPELPPNNIYINSLMPREGFIHCQHQLWETMSVSGMNLESQNVQVRTFCQLIPVHFKHPFNNQSYIKNQARLGMPRGKVSFRWISLGKEFKLREQHDGWPGDLLSQCLSSSVSLWVNERSKRGGRWNWPMVGSCGPRTCAEGWRLLMWSLWSPWTQGRMGLSNPCPAEILLWFLCWIFEWPLCDQFPGCYLVKVELIPFVQLMICDL